MSEWIDISCQKPPNYRLCLVWRSLPKHTSGPYAALVFRGSNGRFYFPDGEEKFRGKVSHWKPVEPPLAAPGREGEKP